MPVTQSRFDHEFYGKLRIANYELNHKDVVELLQLLGETIQECLQKDMREAQAKGWGRSTSSKRRRMPKVQENGQKPKSPSVTVRGVGKFTVREYPAREGRNPQTGEKLQIKASQRMRVAAPKALRDDLGVK